MNHLLKNRELSVLYFFSLMFVLVFLNSPQPNTSPVVFQIPFNRDLATIGLSVLFAILSFLKRRRIDRIAMMLSISVVLGLLPFIYIDKVDSYWGNYYPLVISFLAYFITSQSKYDVADTIKNIFNLFALIISVQILMTEFSIFSTVLPINIADVSIKYKMVIPLGASNLISAFLLPIIGFVLSYKKDKVTIIVSLFSVYAMLFTRSKNTILLILLMAFLVLLKMVYGFILKDKKVSRLGTIGAITFVTILFVGLFSMLFKLSDNILTGLSFNYISEYNNGFLNYLDTVSSGRIRAYQEQLSLFSDNIFFGRGYSYSLGETKSHNWFIDLLVQRGVVGTVIYLLGLGSAISVGNKLYKKDSFSRASINMLGIIFLQGMFEITVFTAGFDFLIWSMCGFLVSRHIQYKTNNGQIPSYENQLKNRTFKKYKIVWR